MAKNESKETCILVVDDSEEVTETLEAVLGKDYRLVVTNRSMEAVALFQKESPDLVLLDVEMPDMDGFELCRILKTMSKDNFVPILFVTGKYDVHSIKEGLQSGAQDYLSKPFEPEELEARIRSSLRTKNLYDKLQEAYAIIDKERDVIAKIQQGLLCDKPPEIPGFKFFSDYQPSSKAGGDYYDFVQIDEDHLGILVSDVSGHGCPAAVIMAMMRVLLRSVFSEVRSPKEALEKINHILCENIKSGHFITAFYGVIHLPTRRMKFASAGHNPPLLIDYDKNTVHQLTTSKGFPLIIFPQNDLEEKEIYLPLNSKLVLYTDGLTEAQNPQGEMFGMERFSDYLLDLGKSLDAVQLGIRIKEMAQEFINSTSFSADESMTDLNMLVQGFVHDTNFTDDYTLVILEVLPESAH